MSIRVSLGVLSLSLLYQTIGWSTEQKSEPYPDLGLIHRDATAPVLQELWLLGRYHGQYHTTEGSDGSDKGWEDRRFRLGFQARMFQKLTVHAQMVSGSDFEPFYNGFTELWASWKFSDAATLTIGQQKHRFTHDRNVSSRYINHLERGMLTNMFALDYTPAVTLSGNLGKDWSYYTGVFSNATERNIGRAFTNLDSGYSFMASATRDLRDSLGTDTAHFNIAYLRSDANANATNMNRFEHGLNAALILTEGSRSLVTEFTAGLGGTAGSAVGLNLQPSVFLTRRTQLVGRYQLAVGEDQSLRAQRRYERPAGLNRGDLYQAGYIGANYYLAGHRAKLLTGIEYARMDSRDAWTFSVGVRAFFGPHSRAPFPAARLLEPATIAD
jgi:phosphate-selective porin OprO and OprP